MAEKIKKTNWKNYPDEVRYSVPVAEANISLLPEATLPSGTTHIDHILYLGRQNHTGKGGVLYRNFWEQRTATAKPQGDLVSLSRYHNILDEQGVPRPPEEELWVAEKVIYVAPFKQLTRIELPQDRKERQSRVTSIVQKKPLTREQIVRGYGVVKEPNKLVELLENEGFPADAFDYLRTDIKYQDNRETVVSEGFQLPGVKKLARVIDRAISGPLSAYARSRGNDKEFKESIRTENLRTR